MFRNRLIPAFLLLLLIAGSVCGAAEKTTALDRYVQAPDPSFRYELISSNTADGITTQVLDLTSQNWLTKDEVDRTEWRHWLVICRPERVATSTALLYIGGGSNTSKPPSSPSKMLTLLAAESGAVVAELRMVPNQPLTFKADGRPRTEDALIAYTWDHYLHTGDERWPARLPMTKSAVRAMDAITGFCAGEPGGKLKIDRFVVAGGSKRGWTTWTTAAVDKRVVAVMPIVIDTLNMEKSIVHHWRAYGFWAPAIGDYKEMNMMDWSDTPQMRALMRIEEPYEYRDRFTMPKYLVNSAGDQYFLPDSSQFYFDDLPGEKYLRYVPNTDHSLANSDVPLSLATWLDSVVKGTARPKFSWKSDRAKGLIQVKAVDKPSEVKLWQATNAKARDFRLLTIGQAWAGKPLEGAGGVYVAQVPKPEQGWTAFFVELTFPSGGKYPWKFTTDVVVVPDVYPFEAPKPRTPAPR